MSLAETILTASDAGHPRPEDDVELLLAFARERGFTPNNDRLGLQDLIGLGPMLSPVSDADRRVAESWDGIVRGAWRALHGIPAPKTPVPGSITVLPFREAFLDAPAYGAVITIEDAGAGTRLRLPSGPPQLVLAFDDLDYDDGVTPVAMLHHADEALAFAREHADGALLVHCQAGQCRSPAVALAIIADRLGPGREAEAVRDLLAIRPQSAANLHVLTLADIALGRGVAIRRAWHDYEDGREDLARIRFLRRAAYEQFTS